MICYGCPALSAGLGRIRAHLVALKMPCAIGALDGVVRRFEQGQFSPFELFEALLAEERTLRGSRRVKMVLLTARLSARPAAVYPAA